MRKPGKKVLSLALALVMCLALMPTAALAGGYDPSWDVAYPVPGGELHFDTKRGYITGCTPGVTVADIPDTINGVTVAEIYNYAFDGCTKLTTVNIPASVTQVWSLAFQGSDSLMEINVARNNANYASIDGVLFDKAITTLVRFPLNKQSAIYNIPDSVTKISESAFSDCDAVKNVVIPDSVTNIDDWAFSNSDSITNVVIGSGITKIGYAMFSGCWSLTSVTIPSSVTSIESDVFWSCDKLRDIYFTGSEAQWNSIKFSKYDEETLKIIASATIHYNSTAPDLPTDPIYNPNDFTIENGVLTKYTGLGGDVAIPDSVTSIGLGAFRDCRGLTSVTIPDSVTSIGDDVFLGCTSLKNIYYGSNDTQWSAIKGDELKLNDVTIHYDSTGPDQSTTPEQPATPDEPDFAIAYASTQNVLMDGKTVEFQAYALKDANGNDTNYVKLRDVAYALNGTAAQFSVGWDQTAKSISVTSGEAYEPNDTEMKTPYSGDRAYTASSSPLYINGEAADLGAILLTDDAGSGYTYFKLRDLGQLLNFNVKWDGVVVIETEKPFTGQ